MIKACACMLVIILRDIKLISKYYLVPNSRLNIRGVNLYGVTYMCYDASNSRSYTYSVL